MIPNPCGSLNAVHYMYGKAQLNQDLLDHDYFGNFKKKKTQKKMI